MLIILKSKLQNYIYDIILLYVYVGHPMKKWMNKYLTLVPFNEMNY